MLSSIQAVLLKNIHTGSAVYLIWLLMVHMALKFGQYSSRSTWISFKSVFKAVHLHMNNDFWFIKVLLATYCPRCLLYAYSFPPLHGLGRYIDGCAFWQDRCVDRWMSRSISAVLTDQTSQESWLSTQQTCAETIFGNFPISRVQSYCTWFWGKLKHICCRRDLFFILNIHFVIHV